MKKYRDGWLQPVLTYIKREPCALRGCFLVSGELAPAIAVARDEDVPEQSRCRRQTRAWDRANQARPATNPLRGRKFSLQDQGDLGGPVYRGKIFRFRSHANQRHNSARLTADEGRWPSSRTRGEMRWTREPRLSKPRANCAARSPSRIRVGWAEPRKRSGLQFHNQPQNAVYPPSITKQSAV